MPSGTNTPFSSPKPILSPTPLSPILHSHDLLPHQPELDVDCADHALASPHAVTLSSDIHDWITGEASLPTMDHFHAHHSVGELLPLLGLHTSRDQNAPQDSHENRAVCGGAADLPQSDPSSPPHPAPIVPPPSNAQGKVKKARKPPTYANPTPSKFCHICSRKPRAAAPHVTCGNLESGACRKSICTNCFAFYEWDLEAARSAAPGSWLCTHCRGKCPERAQCAIYNRTTDRRRLNLINHRKRKGESASGGGQSQDDAVHKKARPASNTCETAVATAGTADCAGAAGAVHRERRACDGGGANLEEKLGGEESREGGDASRDDVCDEGANEEGSDSGDGNGKDCGEAGEQV